jgi:large subunit ribosomal protein L35
MAKQKIKTNRGAAKRLKVTGSGKVKHKKAGLRHKAHSKDESRKRNLKQHSILNDCDAERVKALLPYSF